MSALQTCFRNSRSAKSNASGTHLAVTQVFICHFFGLLFPTA
jgi:hypothetical protein